MPKSKEIELNCWKQTLHNDEIVFRVVQQANGKLREDVRRLGATNNLYSTEHFESPSLEQVLEGYEKWFRNHMGKKIYANDTTE